MNYSCPNSHCNFYKSSDHVIKDGYFYRKNDSRSVQRFKCKSCLKRFCASTLTLEYNQKKRRVNYKIFKLLCSGVSIRRTALILKINPKTVERKLIYLGKKARIKNKRFLNKRNKSHSIIFDDLITKENTKLKPLSVTIATDEDTRHILAVEVFQIPSFGHLAKKSRRKYGYRRCDHLKGLDKVFKSLTNFVWQDCVIKSDEHKKYPYVVSKYFPSAKHLTFKGERAHVAGQGELKKCGFDPLFVINHTCAMLRANINRLIRKTWCTTKDIARLKDHLDIFTYFYNQFYLKTKYLTPI